MYNERGENVMEKVKKPTHIMPDGYDAQTSIDELKTHLEKLRCLWDMAVVY